MIVAFDDRTPPYFVSVLTRIMEQAAKRQFLNVLALAHELEGASIVCFGACLKGRLAGLEAELKAPRAPNPARIVAHDTAIHKAEEAGDADAGDGKGIN